MIKGLNYKLVNTLLVILIIYLIYQTRSFWLGVVSVLWEILLPFFIAFAIAYAVSPIVNFLRDKKIPKSLAIFLVLLFFVLIFGFLIYLITPVFLEQVGSIFDGIISFFKEISLKYNIDFNDVQNRLTKTFNNTLEKLGTYISDGAINIIGVSISVISKIFIVFAALIYFLADMDKIKNRIKNFFLRNNRRIYYYLSTLNKELENYLSGFIKIVFISFFEYSIIYMIIGYPDSLMLGLLAATSNLIPYFGGIITNIIAAITAFVISPDLFIKTCIVFIVFSMVDGYVINPFVYGKTNKVHPLVVIISVFAGGILFGILGIIISLPLTIIIIATYKFFKKDINRFSRRKLKKMSKLT